MQFLMPTCEGTTASLFNTLRVCINHYLAAYLTALTQRLRLIIYRRIASPTNTKMPSPLSGVPLVCNSQDVAPGQTVAYQFKGGTSYRQIRLKAPVIVNRAATMICQITMRSFIDEGCGLVGPKKILDDGNMTVTNLDHPETLTAYWNALGRAGIANGVQYNCHCPH